MYNSSMNQTQSRRSEHTADVRNVLYCVNSHALRYTTAFLLHFKCQIRKPYSYTIRCQARTRITTATPAATGRQATQAREPAEQTEATQYRPIRTTRTSRCPSRTALCGIMPRSCGFIMEIPICSPKISRWDSLRRDIFSRFWFYLTIRL